MNFLIDTNILIPMEPGSPQDIEVSTPLALHFSRLVTSSQNRIFIHPEIVHDFDRDRDRIRAGLRQTLMARYPTLETPPSATNLNSADVGTPVRGSNDWVDNSLLAAVKYDAVDYLVTEDDGIHRKARRIGIGDRVLKLQDAIILLSDLFDQPIQTPLSVTNPYVYNVNPDDPIFTSIRRDYPDFDVWLEKCRREQRRAFVLPKSADGEIGAICIYNREQSQSVLEALDLHGKILKLCTFKVSPDCSGNRFGELLLKAIFDYATSNSYTHVFFTAYPYRQDLFNFAADFGFSGINYCEGYAYIKKMIPSPTERLFTSPLELHIRYGPNITSFDGNESYVVPIKPIYHEMLFPEISTQKTMFPHPCGNSIKKAYLSHSKCKSIESGDNVFFYRSKDAMSLTVLGIVEATCRSRDPHTIARFVGTRTVYSFDKICKLCEHKEVLALNFRLVRFIDPLIPLDTLVSSGTLNGSPQAITRLRESGIEWLQCEIGM